MNPELNTSCSPRTEDLTPSLNGVSLAVGNAFPALDVMSRRSFSAAAAALSAAALLSGCRSASKPARDATLLHNRAVREAVTELQSAMNAMDERLGQFNAENWQDAVANLQTATIRMHNSIDDLKRALGYAEAS